MQELTHMSENILNVILLYLPRITTALAMLIIGLWLIKIAHKMIKTMLEKTEIDASLKPFLASLINITLKILLFISVASTLGVETTSFVALLGAAGIWIDR